MSWGSMTRSHGRVSSPRPNRSGPGTERRGRRGPRATCARSGPPSVPLANPGYAKFRNGGEHHATEPAVVRAVHRIADPTLERLRTNAWCEMRGPATRWARLTRRTGPSGRRSRRVLREDAAIVHARPPTAIRDLLDFVPGSREFPDESKPWTDPGAVLDWRDLARLDLGGGTRDARARYERDRRPVEHGGGRRGSREVPDR